MRFAYPSKNTVEASSEKAKLNGKPINLEDSDGIKQY